ncbi:MAG TPA: hypothetical protein VHT27_10850 [Solirubrobacteraceae bacterium]|nr:hypothetical protein [Solirubrobacteraceae bacterium]
MADNRLAPAAARAARIARFRSRGRVRAVAGERRVRPVLPERKCGSTPEGFLSGGFSLPGTSLRALPSAEVDRVNVLWTLSSGP